MNIVLIGMRATGKTTVAKILAGKLKRDHIEIDELVVERSGLSIPEIVEKSGWEYFRDLESKVTKELAQIDNKIISTGGGVVTRKENTEILEKTGFLILLTASIDTMLLRMGNGTNRPSLTEKGSVREEIAEVLKQRKILYEKACNVIIATDNQNPEEVGERILAVVKERNL